MDFTMKNILLWTIRLRYFNHLEGEKSRHVRTYLTTQSTISPKAFFLESCIKMNVLLCFF